MRIVCKIKKRHGGFFLHNQSKVATVVGRFLKYRKTPYYAEDLEIFFENGLVFFKSDKGSIQIRDGDIVILPHVEVCFELNTTQNTPQSKMTTELISHPTLDPAQKDALDFLFKGSAVNLLNHTQNDFPRV
jgi:hypothetical protein